MCIAILKPKDKIISEDILRTCYKRNKDGIGFAYTDGKCIYINKYMNFDDFYKDYKQVENISNMLIHFRIATHGEVRVENCHPFKLNHRMALIHNGIISGYGDKKNKTDTLDFIEQVIGNISWKLWKNPSYRKLVGDAIGYSKLAILDVTGDYFIINEDKGEWSDGIWYSNGSYKVEVEKPKQQKLYYHWDMYGEETYDEWYENNKKFLEPEVVDDDKDFKIVYKCNKCGKEFKELDGVIDPQCDVCKSLDVKEIGVAKGKEQYLYADMIG